MDGGGPRRAADLVALARRGAVAAGLAGEETERAFRRLEPGLREYAEGHWPRRATLFLEHAIRHVLSAPDGFSVELRLRVDRVARFRRSVAILDFKTVSPHVLEMRADQWQLRTYALAAPELLGVSAAGVHLVLVDLARAEEVVVGNDEVSRRAAAGELLANARGIADAEYDVGQGHPDRPCWSCGFRLACPASLAPRRPSRP